MHLIGSLARRILSLTPYELRRREEERILPDGNFDNVRLALAYYLETRRNLTFMQIGACDGVSGDSVHDFVKRGQMRAILVEPIETSFRKLKAAYEGIPNVTLVHAAIAKQDGEVSIYSVREGAGSINAFWSRQLASFSKVHLTKHGVANEDIVEMKVPALTLATVQALHGFDRIDILQVDTEGFDGEIVRMALGLPQAPECINFEHVHLNGDVVCYDPLCGCPNGSDRWRPFSLGNTCSEALALLPGSARNLSMKSIVKGLLARVVRPVVNQLELTLGRKFLNNEVVAQKLLVQQFRTLAAADKDLLPSFADVGFRKYSQFEEDGILLFIFALVPPLNRKCVEICAGSGRECMAANLIVNHGWWGYLFDGNEHNVRAGRQFFSSSPDTFFEPPQYTQAWITAENVNDSIAKSGVSGPIDLLSLDMDGMDYWVWKAISVIQPQVVVCETHNQIPPDKALTVPYDPAFQCESEDFRSASLAAMNKLAIEKGYRLIGTHRFGFNAFFMKNGVGEAYFPAVEPAACLNDPVSERLRAEKWPTTQKFNWTEV
jgi:FkbM family methyltransferase